MNILLLIGGLILILLGANGLTDGAASVAKRFRIPSIVIGLTIVAFGTSAPELTVSVASALKGSADIAIGNVVGSNIFNTLMIVGCTALFAPIVITRNTLRKEIPLCILSSVVLLICANDIFLDNATENILNRVDGLLLLCFFAIFMGYTFAIAFPKSSAAPEPAVPEHTAPEEEIKLLSWWKSILYIIGRTGGTHLWRSAVRQRGYRDCPQHGSQRIHYRINAGSRRNFPAGACHFHRRRTEKESGNGYRKCNRQ